MDTTWEVTYTRDVHKKPANRSKKGGLVVVRGGRANLYACPEEDGVPTGASLASSEAVSAIEEDAELQWENFLIFFNHPLTSAQPGAAPAGVVAPTRAATMLSAPPRAYDAGKPAPFRPPGRAAQTAPPVPRDAPAPCRADAEHRAPPRPLFAAPPERAGGGSFNLARACAAASAPTAACLPEPQRRDAAAAAAAAAAASPPWRAPAAAPLAKPVAQLSDAELIESFTYWEDKGCEAAPDDDDDDDFGGALEAGAATTVTVTWSQPAAVPDAVLQPFVQWAAVDAAELDDDDVDAAAVACTDDDAPVDISFPDGAASGAVVADAAVADGAAERAAGADAAVADSAPLSSAAADAGAAVQDCPPGAAFKRARTDLHAAPARAPLQQLRLPPPSAAPSGSFRAPALVPRAGASSGGARSERAGAGQGALSLRVPSPLEAPQSCLTSVVPATFASAAEYVGALSGALAEYLQLQLAQEARRFHSALQGATLPSDVAAAARRARLSYYESVELRMWLTDAQFGGKRGRAAKDVDDADDAAAAAGPTFFLRLSDREAASKYARGDLWLLSGSPRLDPQASWSVVAMATYHGPNPDGKLGVRLLGPHPPGLSGSNRWLRGAALRCDISAGCELDQLTALLDLAAGGTAALPLLPLLLQRRAGPAAAPALDVQTVALMDSFRLNEDQTLVVQAATAGVVDAPSSPHVLLVQGPFGCGKTTTLATLVRHLAATLQARGSSERILVAGFTNASVDGLLCALLDAGFDDFVRCGALRRIAPRVLPHAIGGSTDKTIDEKDLKGALAEATTAAARASIQAELAALAAGRNSARARRLGTCRVVAVTTASCVQERLKDRTFGFVLIDEAAQLTEPAALLPLVRFGARCCILVGDPAQLPPLLLSADERCHLQRPLFTRLMEAGHAPLLLRTQYRCHPALSATPNKLFYGGRLLDGVTAADRLPLMPSLPPLLFMDVACGGEVEATLVRRLVDVLTANGVARADIAVITFFKREVAAIQQGLSLFTGEGEPDDALLVSTIDAFQGQEREVIILSFAGLQPGFATPERLNVALSRARRHLLCVGRSRGHCRGASWLAALLQAVRHTPRAYMPVKDVHAPLPRWHEAPEVAQPVAMHVDGEPGAEAPQLPSSDSGEAEPSEADELTDADVVHDAAPLAAAVLSSPGSSLGMTSPPPPAATYLCSAEAEAALSAAAFTSADLWDGFKAFHVLQYSPKPASAERAAFHATKLGTLLRQLYPVGRGRSLQRPFAQAYLEAEAFVARLEGLESVRLSSLLAHVDVEALRREHPAFAWHVLKDAAEEEGGPVDGAEGAVPDVVVLDADATSADEPEHGGAAPPEAPGPDPGAAALEVDSYLF